MSHSEKGCSADAAGHCSLTVYYEPVAILAVWLLQHSVSESHNCETPLCAELEFKEVHFLHRVNLQAVL